MNAWRLLLGVAVTGLALLVNWPGVTVQHIAHGRFKDVSVYAPRGEIRQFVLMLSAEDGWTEKMAAAALALTARGAMVAGIDTPQFLADLDLDAAECVLPDGDLENLAHYLQAYYRLPAYHAPLLTGLASGASLAYAVAAQAPKDVFAGLMTAGFCADLQPTMRLCEAGSLHYDVGKDGQVLRLHPAGKLPLPWISLHGNYGSTCSPASSNLFAAAVAGTRLVMFNNAEDAYPSTEIWCKQYGVIPSLASPAQQGLAPPAELSDLPIVEIPATGAGEMFAVLISGDGGWAGLDKQVAAALAQSGIPVVGVDSLRYFWREHTPDDIATDLGRIMHHYAAHWRRPKALLIGYSQGADVMPFAVARLPAATRAMIPLQVLLGLGERAQFAFHLSNWVHSSAEGLPIAPELEKLDVRTLCIYGEDDADSLCPRLGNSTLQAMRVPGGHHFNGDYRGLAKTILAAAAA